MPCGAAVFFGVVVVVVVVVPVVVVVVVFGGLGFGFVPTRTIPGSARYDDDQVVSERSFPVAE
jgi:hypothetical protein